MSVRLGALKWTFMARFDWLLFIDRYRRVNHTYIALIHPKSYVECRNGVSDGQINYENSKAELAIKLGYVCRNWW